MFTEVAYLVARSAGRDLGRGTRTMLRADDQGGVGPSPECRRLFVWRTPNAAQCFLFAIQHSCSSRHHQSLLIWALLPLSPRGSPDTCRRLGRESQHQARREQGGRDTATLPCVDASLQGSVG